MDWIALIQDPSPVVSFGGEGRRGGQGQGAFGAAISSTTTSAPHSHRSSDSLYLQGGRGVLIACQFFVFIFMQSTSFYEFPILLSSVLSCLKVTTSFIIVALFGSLFTYITR